MISHKRATRFNTWRLTADEEEKIGQSKGLSQTRMYILYQTNLGRMSLQTTLSQQKRLGLPHEPTYRIEDDHEKSCISSCEVQEFSQGWSGFLLICPSVFTDCWRECSPILTGPRFVQYLWGSGGRWRLGRYAPRYRLWLRSFSFGIQRHLKAHREKFKR